MRARESTCFRAIFVAAACARIARCHARAVLRRAQALQKGATGGHGRPESPTEFRSSWPVRGRTWRSFKPNVLPVSINRRVSIEVSGQWLFENARHSSDTNV